MHAFDLADEYRTPVMVLADGMLGQMMEPVVLPEHQTEFPAKPWATTGKTKDRERNVIFIGPLALDGDAGLPAKAGADDPVHHAPHISAHNTGQVDLRPGGDGMLLCADAEVGGRSGGGLCQGWREAGRTLRASARRKAINKEKMQ